MIVLDLKKLPPPFLKNVLKLLHKNSFPFYSVVFQYYIIKCSNVLSGLINNLIRANRSDENVH